MVTMGFERMPTADERPGDVIRDAEKRIMSFDAYRETEHETPYVFELKDGKRELAYFGAEHSVDPENPMFGRLREKLEAFTAEHPEDGVIFIEADIRSSDIEGLTEEEVIRKKNGESGFTRLLGDRAGVPVECPEPEEKDFAPEVIAEGWSPEDYAVAYMLRSMNYDLRTMKTPLTYEEMGSLFFEAADFVPVGWADGHPSRAEMRERFMKDREGALKELGRIGKEATTAFRAHLREMTGRDLDREGAEGDLDFDAELVEAYADPADFGGRKAPTNRIAAAMSEARDRHIVRRIGEAVKDGKSVFVTYGASHAVMQEPALREIFEKTRAV